MVHHGIVISCCRHRSRTAFGQARKETIVPLKKNAVIGQREHLSDVDVLRINRLYKC